MNNKIYALLVIDMQLVAFDGKITPPVINSSPLISKVADLIEIFRSTNTAVIFLQTCAAAGQPYAEDVHGWEIHPQVAPQKTEQVLFKVGASGFENPRLKEVLDDMVVNSVIVCGIWSEGCVALTCESALELDYKVYLASDGHSTVRETESDTAGVIAEQNEKLRRKGVEVIDIEMIRDRLA